MKKKKAKTTLKQILVIVLVIIIILATVATFSLGAYADTKLNLVAESAIIYCATTDEVIFEQNADSVYNMASLAKLMTCYLALQELGPDAIVDCGKDERKSIDLMYSALLQSDNNAALYLAEAVDDDIVTFSERMNKQATEWGCTNTTFGNASGINGLCTGTARDISIIASHVYSDETIRMISGAESYTMPASKKEKAKEIKNINLLLTGGSFKTSTNYYMNVNKNDAIFAGKTGTTDDSHTTLALGVDCDGLDCYIVILNSSWDYRYSDGEKLVNFALQNTTKYIACTKGEEFGVGKVYGGSDNVITGVASNDGIINLPEGASGSLVVCTPTFNERIEAPLYEGDVIGKIDITLAGEHIRTIDLVAKNDLKAGWFLSRFRVTNAQTVLIFSLIFAILVLFILVLTLRAINRRKHAEARRQRLLAEAQRQMNREKDVKARNWPY